MRNLVDLPRPTGAGPDGMTPNQDPLEEEAVGEEEQSQYDQFVVHALKFIHGPESRDAIIDHMNQPDLSVPEAVGRTAAFIAMRVSESAKAQGAELSPDAVFHAGTEIVQELMEVGARAKVLPIEWPEPDANGEVTLPPETEELLEQAFAVGVHEYGKQIVQTEDGKALAEEAGNFAATQVAKEADAGTLDPEFAGKNDKVGPRRDTPVAQGVRRALIPEE